MLEKLFNPITTPALLMIALIVHLAVTGTAFSQDTDSVSQTNALTLTWDANIPEPEGYRIFMRTDNTSYDYTQPVWTGTDTTGTVSSLAYDTTYYFVVRAYDGTQESVNSEEVSCNTPEPDTQFYTIVVTADEHGSISPVGIQTVVEGTDQTFTIAPDTGYQIADVVVDGWSVGAVSTYTFSGVDADHTISATFAINEYSIIATAGSGGSVSPAGETAVSAGGTQTYTISADESYRISDVVVDEWSVGAVNTYTFSDVDADHTISAVFVIDRYTISATAGSGGEVSPAGVSEVSAGGSHTYTITADEGNQVVDVVVDDVSMGPLETFTFAYVSGDHTLSATFAEDEIVAIQIEAEDGDLYSPMEIGDDLSASAGGYVWVSDESPAVDGEAVYSVDIPVAGDYYIWGRLIANDTNGDSISISIDDQATMVWYTRISEDGAWTWDVVSQRTEDEVRVTTNPQLVSLSVGPHKFVISTEEKGIKVDKLLITNQPDMPSQDVDSDPKRKAMIALAFIPLLLLSD